jgi:hypothetical protein
MQGVGLAASVFGAPGAFAELNDTPYYNLWTKNVTYDGLKGDGTSISLCGTSACDATNKPGSPNQYAQFSVITQQPAGSGYIDPFLRFQHNEGANTGSDTTEAAFNTNYRDGSQGTGLISGYDAPITTTNQAKDTKAGGDKRDFFNHAIRLGDLQVDENGMVTFLLDINETGNPGVTLRLDELAWYVSDVDDLSHYYADTSIGDPSGNSKLTNADGTKQGVEAWNMDWNAASPGGTGHGGLNLSNINDSGKAGSGDFDLQVKLDKNLFLEAAKNISASLGDNAYVYLYNFAGRVGDSKKDQDGTEAEAGFEEWAAVLGASPPPDNGVPEPSTALLLLGGLAGMLKIQRQRKASA